VCVCSIIRSTYCEDFSLCIIPYFEVAHCHSHGIHGHSLGQKAEISKVEKMKNCREYNALVSVVVNKIQQRALVGNRTHSG
jgi:hypothetical protein